MLLSKVDFTSILSYMRLTENKVHDLYEVYESLVLRAKKDYKFGKIFK
jgi:hypothetical protein